MLMYDYALLFDPTTGEESVVLLDIGFWIGPFADYVTKKTAAK